MKKKKPKLKEKIQERLEKDNAFFSDVEGMIKSQKKTDISEKELARRAMEKQDGEYVVTMTTIKKLTTCMRKYGHIEWIENVLNKRVKAHFGDTYSGKSLSGPREPVNGDQREYAVNVDSAGRRFVRIPVSLLQTERGEKVTVMFHNQEIVIKPKRRAL